MRKSVPAVAVILAAVAASYSIVSSSSNAHELVGGLHASHTVASDFRLAMMDDMMEMKDKGSGMGGMGGGKMGGNMPPAGAMPDAGSPGGVQEPMAAPSISDMMGRVRGSMQQRPGMSGPASRLPGFPGASHLYHVGATGFFLDHPQHITFSVEQQTTLNRIREKALLDRSSSDRRSEEAEQELWMLTAEDVPDAVRIEAQVRAIEKLRGDQRLAFIRAVGEAGKVLSADQRIALLGTNPQAGSRPTGTGKRAPMAPMPNK